MKRLVDNVPVLAEGKSYDSKFVTLLASCLQGEPSCDARQVFLFEDLFEEVDDGLLCSLSLRHDRSSLGDTIFPHESLIGKMKHLSDNLPVNHQYVLPQRFVTSSLVQSLKKVDSMRPGVEVEINSPTEEIAKELRPLMQNVRTLTLPHLSFEHCSVYRGTLGKVSPVLQKDPASVVLTWEPGDFEKVFFVLVNQLRAFYEKLDLTKLSFIVFSGEITGKLLRRIPDSPGSTGSDDPSFQYPPVPRGDLSDWILTSLGVFDVDDEDMPPRHSDDPPKPGPPGSGPYGGGPYGPVLSQDTHDTPPPDGPSGPSAGAVPWYSHPDVPLSHPGTNAPPFISAR